MTTSHPSTHDAGAGELTSSSPAWRVDRLFDAAPSPAESRARARANAAGALSLFELEPASSSPACPACAGLEDACTCSSTGARALDLFAGAELEEQHATAEEYELAGRPDMSTPDARARHRAAIAARSIPDEPCARCGNDDAATGIVRGARRYCVPCSYCDRAHCAAPALHPGGPCLAHSETELEELEHQDHAGAELEPEDLERLEHLCSTLRPDLEPAPALVIDRTPAPDLLGLELEPTPAMLKDEQHIYQCAYCGMVAVVPLRRDRDGFRNNLAGAPCPNCDHSTWWRQELPLAGLRRPT